jgi:tripartite ATP-independent transporter DctP family solute receptor
MTLFGNAKTIGFGIAIAIAPLATTLSAQEVLKWGHVYEASTPYHAAAVAAGQAFEAATEGRYTIEVFPASQLGKEVALNEGLALGTVDIIYTGLAFLGQSYPPIAISDYPFVLDGFDHWKAYSESDLFSEMSAEYSNITGNHVVPALTYYGARHVTSNKPILQPSDMEGLKIRVPNAPAYLMFPEETGANPTPMAFAEVYLALQQGVVDAQENPLPTIQFKRFYEVQSNINLTAHITNSLVTLISPLAASKLSEEDAAALEKVLIDAAAQASAEINTAESELVSWFREQGATVNEVDRGPFIAAVAPALTADGVPWSADIYERLQALK